MKKRKYITEYAVGYCSGRWSMMTAGSLMSDGVLDESSAEILSQCHIYLIASRPASHFDPEKIKFEDGKLSGEIVYRKAGVSVALPFIEPFTLMGGATSLKVSPYPHKEIWACDDAGEVKRYLPAEYISSKINSYSDVGVFDKFNVLYVGQAFGDGNRAALDRLKSHSTLQKILARTPYDLPDEEIVIFAFEYSQDQVFTTMDGRAEGAISDDSNEERLFNAIDNPPSKKQKISMIEAGLIRYFQPKYNKVFVNKFPSIKAKTLKSCLDLDVTGLVVELNTDELGFYLYSDVVSPKMHHFANYELVASKDRASFFNVTGMVDFPGVIGARN